MNNNESIKNSIRRIIAAGSTDAIEFLDCYVTKVFQKGEDGYGTINVKTINSQLSIEGVSLSAISENVRGELKLPTLLSEVTVAFIDGSSGFVSKYSQIDSQIIDSNKELSIGVTGLDDSTDEQDYDEVGFNGKKSNSDYTPESIVTTVSNIDEEGGADELSDISMSSTSIVSSVSNNTASKSTSVTQSSTDVKIESESSSIDVDRTSVNVKSPTIKLSNGGATQNAVLGVALKTVMNAFIDQVGTITTTTAIGPQPILNAAMVIALKSQVETILSNVNFIE